MREAPKPVEAASGGVTSVSVPQLTAGELAVPLETMLGRRVVVDRGAAATIVKLATAYPLSPSESKAWATMQLHAAGLMLVETPIAAVIGKPEDEARLRAIATGRVGESANARSVVPLNYVEAAELVRMLSADASQPAAAFARSSPVPPEMRSSASLAGLPDAAPSYSPAPLSSPTGREERTGPLMAHFQRDGVLITCDGRNRQLILEGESAAVRKLETWVRQIDKRPQGVVIEAVIGELTTGRAVDFGVDWQRVLKEAGTKWTAAFEQATTLGNDPALTGTLTEFSRFPRQMGFTAYGTYMGELAVAVNALEANGNFRVVQRPTIATLNDTMATIFVGQQVPIQKQTLTQGGATAQNATLAATMEFVPVRLQIDVTPHIYAHNEVRLEISERHNDVAGFATIGGNQVPRISEQGMNNVIVCPDGGTVLMGGLVTQQTSKDKQGVPVLSRIPLLGRAFARSRDSHERRQLVIMLHVRIDGTAAASVQSTMDYAIDNEVPTEMSGPAAWQRIRDITPRFR